MALLVHVRGMGKYESGFWGKERCGQGTKALDTGSGIKLHTSAGGPDQLAKKPGVSEGAKKTQ